MSLETQFSREMLKSVPPEFRGLLEAATEVQVKHGLKNGAEASRTNGEGPEWERFRAALMDCARAGYVADEWRLGERF